MTHPRAATTFPPQQSRTAAGGRRTARMAVGTLSALALSVGLVSLPAVSINGTPVAAAHAADTPLTATNQMGGTVTISNDHVSPGGSLTLRGEGFTQTEGGTNGDPILALKLNAGDFTWQASGPSVVPAGAGAPAGEEFVPLRVAADGTFSVTITVPAGWSTFGKQTINFLGGSQSTGNKVLKPQSFTASIPVLAPTQGWAEVTSVAHAQDSKNNSVVSVKLRNFRAGADGLGGAQKVGVKLNSAGDITHCLETDADGDLDTTLTLPAKEAIKLAAGTHHYRFLAGTECQTGGAPVTQGPPKSVQADFKLATADVTSTTHQAGGTVDLSLRGLVVANGSRGQRVGLKLTGPGLGDGAALCVDTDALGNLDTTYPLPADLAPGSYVLNTLAGTACGDGPQAPGRSLQSPVEVTEAPAALTVVTGSTISGTARVGSVLTSSTPVFSAPTTSVETAWLRNGKPIAGATSAKLTLTAADLGARITVRHTATTAAGTTATTTSGATASVAQGRFTVKKKVRISGTARVGKRLSATRATFSTPGVRTTYRWLRNGKAISKATKATYRVTRTDRGRTLSLRVTHSKAGHRTVVLTVRAPRVR